MTTGVEVTDFERRGERVAAKLATGESVEADLLVGSDGIRSRLRDILDPRGSVPPTWSGYTCFAGIAKVRPADIEEVGYKVWLGARKYFVSVDVGQGRIQWYAFLNIPPGSLSVAPGAESIDFLRSAQFGDWSDEVHQLLDNTAYEDVEQRDLYDRPPQLRWVKGRVALLGDAAHPMMPNLGQGGGMAIEDALVLGTELRSIFDTSDMPFALKKYNDNRVLRAASVQGLSRFSSSILFAYSHPTSLVDGKLINVGIRSLITRACQGFLQRVAFPLQFEYLFSFPGPLDPLVFEEQRRPGDFLSPSPLASASRRASSARAGEASVSLSQERSLWVIGFRSTGECLSSRRAGVICVDNKTMSWVCTVHMNVHVRSWRVVRGEWKSVQRVSNRLFTLAREHTVHAREFGSTHRLKVETHQGRCAPPTWLRWLLSIIHTDTAHCSCWRAPPRSPCLAASLI